MRFLFFPNLDHINNQIHGRSTGERRYTCKFSVFSLKSTKEQRAQRQELIKIINARVQHMKSMGISTSSGIDDLTKPHIRKLYTILISILNTSYGDYNFANTAFENFIPTTPQQCLDQIYNDILLPLDHYDNRSKFSFHRAPLNSTEGGAQSAKYQLLMSLREAIGFDLVANINNQKNTDGVIPSINRAGQPVEKELNDDSDEEEQESPTPAQNGDSPQQPTPTPSTLTPQPMRTPQGSGNPNKQLYIFEYDNDGDNPLFSESRLWTHVYLIYNPILKRAMLITVGCKSTQGLYSPAIVPQMAHRGKGYDLDDLDDFSLGAGATTNFSSYKKNNPNNSFSAVSGVDTSGLDGTVTFSDDEGSTDDEEYEFDDSNANMKLSVVQRLLQLEEEEDDDEEEEEEEMRDQPSENHYNNNNQSTYSFNPQHRIMNTHPLPQDDFLIPNNVNSPQNHEITPDDLPINTNNNNNNNNNPALSSHSKSRHSHNNNQQSLYSYEPTNQYSSMSRHSGRRDENGMMENQSFVSSTISYTNHVELVERNGELEIIPVLMDPRQLAQMKRQEEEKKQQQQTALKQQEMVGHQSHQ